MVEINNAGSVSPQQMQRLRAQAEEMEGVFLNMLTKQMFSGLKSDENFGGGFGEETWRSMQAEELANTMARNGGVGIADQLLGEMIAAQEAANASRTMFVPSAGVYGK